MPSDRPRRLGRSGLLVSPICLGTMNFGGPTDAAEADRIVARCREAGVNFIDTANVYTGGASEEIVGRAIASARHHWVLATKANGKFADDPNGQGSSRKALLEAVHASLRRLGTDYIDILYLHREDTETPLAESVHALADMQRAGLIRYFALSNHKAWRVAEICSLCDRLGIDRPVVSQPYYNAMNRTLEVEHLPACDFYGLGVVPYSPLARGVLSGRYDPGKPPPADSRAGRGDARMMQTEWRPESLAIAHALAEHARNRGLTLAQFAVAWVLNNPLVTSVIAGPRVAAQLDDYLAAPGIRLTTEDEALVNSFVTPGHSSTPGYTDPVEPVMGRPVFAR